jgi:hypothetical protein
MWSASGAKLIEGTWKNDLRDGEWTYWNENGSKRKSGPFVAGKPNGVWTVWGDDGKERKEGELRDGKRVGVWRSFDSEGKEIAVTDAGQPADAGPISKGVPAKKIDEPAAKKGDADQPVEAKAE